MGVSLSAGQLLGIMMWLVADSSGCETRQAGTAKQAKAVLWGIFQDSAHLSQRRGWMSDAGTIFLYRNGTVLANP